MVRLPKEASGGKVATRFYKASPTDLFFPYLVMPEKEDLELIEEFR